MPPLPFAASTFAYSTSGLTGEMARPMRPSCSVGSPVVIFFHVFPPSVLR